jgi:N utilization substance protein B
MSNPRRQSRELALQLLFQSEFDKDFDKSKTFRRFVENFGITEEVQKYGQPLLEGIWEHLSEIDSVIQAASPKWKVYRMGAVDRNILRIAAFELLFSAGDIPPRVAINEAIEMGKVFGNTDSGAFINGILDQVARDKNLFT